MASLSSVNRFIFDLVHDRDNAHGFLREQGIDSLLERYALTSDQQQALREPSRESLAAIGVHPICQLLLMVELHPHITSNLSARKYAERMWGNVSALER